MSEPNADELDGLDPAIIERLEGGTATKDDELARLEHLRRNAAAQGDAARVEALDAQVSTLRIGE